MSRGRSEGRGGLTWRAGQVVARRYTFDSKVLGAATCTFEASEPAAVPLTCLAVIEAEDKVVVYGQDGAVHSVALSGRPRAIWPIRRGVLIESDDGAAGAADSPLLLLQTSLDEPVAVLLQGGAGGTAAGRILMSDASHSRILTHDAASQAHAVWTIASGDAGAAVGDAATGEPGPMSPATPPSLPPSGEFGPADGASYPPRRPQPVARLVWCQPAGSARSPSTSHFYLDDDGAAGRSFSSRRSLLFLHHAESQALHVHAVPACEDADAGWESGAPLAGGAPLASIPAAACTSTRAPLC